MTFCLFELDSEAELKDRCSKWNAILLGNEAEVKRNYYYVEICYHGLKRSIGIINEGQGIKPSVVELQSPEELLISSDKSIYIIDFINKQLLLHLVCDSLIYGTVFDEKSKNFFVICELGIKCLSTNGNVIWKYDSDIIDDYRFVNEHIELVIEGDLIKLSLSNGDVMEN